MENGLVTDFDVRHSIANGMNPASVFVADGVGELDAGFLLPLAFEDVEV